MCITLSLIGIRSSDHYMAINKMAAKKRTVDGNWDHHAISETNFIQPFEAETRLDHI
jgi:hypothetical protein